MNSDSELLKCYAEMQSEDAFSELVARHLNLVYGVALRRVNGDAHLARDVSQLVFIDLARKAKSLSGRASLSGWLYTSAHFASSRLVRGEIRRHERERVFHSTPATVETSREETMDWNKVGPLIDDAMQRLNEADREAILLRYFQNQRLAEVGAKLGLSENAARMRIERALEKLRKYLSRGGIETTDIALASAISIHAAPSAPLGMAAALAAGALAGASLGGGSTLAVGVLGATKLKIAVAAIVIGGLMVAWLQQRSQQSALHFENQRLRDREVRLQSEAMAVSNQWMRAREAQTLSREQLNELLRLRSEVAALREAQAKTQIAGHAASDTSVAPIPTVAGPDSRPFIVPTQPFQLHLVVADSDENSGRMTNIFRGGDGTIETNTILVRDVPLIDSRFVKSAVAETDASGVTRIDVVFNEAGRDRFATVTRENIGKQLAISLEGRSYAMPVLRTEIPGGRVQITGAFTPEDAAAIAARINAASQPPP
jgi:RNA polymerase sigma factor (sigma-70 family)